MVSDELGRPRPSGTDPESKRRVAMLIAVLALTAPLLAVGVFGDALGLRTEVWGPVALVAAVAGTGALFWASEPGRRQELRENVGKPPAAMTWRMVGLLLAPMLPVPFVMHFLFGTPWREAWGIAAAIVAYFAIFIPLARLQRHGISPYLRPAWHGFVVAGIVAGAVGSAVASTTAVDAIIRGVVCSLMHYGYVRWVMRGAASHAGTGNGNG